MIQLKFRTLFYVTLKMISHFPNCFETRRWIDEKIYNTGKVKKLPVLYFSSIFCWRSRNSQWRHKFNFLLAIFNMLLCILVWLFQAIFSIDVLFLQKKKFSGLFITFFFWWKSRNLGYKKAFFLLSLLHISWDWVTFLPGFAVHLFQNKSYFVLEKEIWREDETTRVFQNRKDGLFGPFVLNLRFFEALKCPSFSVIAWFKSCETSKSKQIHGLYGCVNVYKLRLFDPLQKTRNCKALEFDQPVHHASATHIVWLQWEFATYCFYSAGLRPS